jgi:hypothetical protein
VKLPFSWPNRIDSTRFSGMAPQLTATKGLPARSEAPCTARAIISLPTPLSPVIRIGIDDLAARWPRRLTMVMAGGLADQVVEGGAPRGVLLQAVDLALQSAHRQSVADRHQDAFGRGGLDEEVLAPACMAWTTVSMPPVAVMTITGWLKPRARISFRVSWPEMPGITRSSRTTSAWPPAFSAPMASSPFSAWETAKPSRSRHPG